MTFQKGVIGYWKGKKRSKKTKKKMRLAQLGEKSSRFGKHPSKITRKKMSEAQSGDKSYRWKGGKRKSNGYIQIWTTNGYVFEHRLVMEKHLGRKLYPWEIIHHINGIKDDNRIENLEVLPDGKHNKQVQKVYQENIKLKQKILELEKELGIRIKIDKENFRALKELSESKNHFQ